MWVQQSQMQQALQQQVCALTEAIQQLAETQQVATAWTSEETVVRDGSTPKGQRLREQLWVWLHLQDEGATEPVPKQLQSWLTGQKTQQRKKYKRNRRRHSSQVDLIEIFSTPRIVPHAGRQGLRTTTPTNLNVTEDWDATTVTGRDRLKHILRRQKPG